MVTAGKRNVSTNEAVFIRMLQATHNKYCGMETKIALGYYAVTHYMCDCGFVYGCIHLKGIYNCFEIDSILTFVYQKPLFCHDAPQICNH